jgi:ankyrin repeat protein
MRINNLTHIIMKNKIYKNRKILFTTFLVFFFLNLFAQDSDLLNKVRDNDLNAVKEMLVAGADVNMQDDMMGYTPLMLSVYNGHKEMAELLLSNGANINLQDNRTGYTPLMMALQSNKVELAQFFIDKGADFKIKSNDGATALILACGVSPELSKLLLSKGADIHALTEKGQGVFTQCIVAGMMRGNEAITPEFAEYLLSKGADIDEKNTMGGYKGYTPLFWAVLYDEADVVKFLAEKGSDVNARAENGNTPLSIASDAGDKNIVEILKNHGAK